MHGLGICESNVGAVEETAAARPVARVRARWLACDSGARGEI